jgi:hypothetical protein
LGNDFGSDDGTQQHSNVSGVQHSIRKDFNATGTPIKNPTNPYNTGQTPLTDKYLGQCNDFYLRGALGLLNAEDFTADYYSVFGFPPSHFTPIQYAFLELFENDEPPQLEEKQIKTLPRLTSLDPEAFVDWYTSM